MTAAGSVCRTSCVAVVGAVACPARWFPGIALGDSGGASPSPTPINPRNLAMFRAFLRPAHQNCAARPPTAGNSGSPGEGPGNRSTILQRSRHHPQNVYAIYVTGTVQGRREKGARSNQYPREVLRGERPKRVLVPFDRAKGTPSGKRPHQACKPETWEVRRAASQSGIIYIRNKRNTPPRAGTACPLIPQVSECEWSPSPHPPLPPWCTGCAVPPPP